MNGKEGFSNKILMIQCPYCKTVFKVDDYSNIVCPKCHARIELVAVPKDSLDIELARTFVHFLNKAIDVVFNALEKKIEQRETRPKRDLRKKLEEWKRGRRNEAE